MLIGEIISNIKNILSRGPAANSSRISDRQVYFIIKYLRAKLLKQKLDKYNFVSQFNYQTLTCLPLELVSEENCACLGTDCKILMSKFKLPKVISNRNQMMLTVWTLAGQQLSPATRDEFKRFKYSHTKGKGLYYDIINEYIVIYGSTRLTTIKLEAIFEDPLAINIPGACDPNNTGQSCFDPYSTEFPLDMEMISDLNKMSYTELYNVMMRVAEDIEPNSLDTNPAQDRTD